MPVDHYQFLPVLCLLYQCRSSGTSLAGWPGSAIADKLHSARSTILLQYRSSQLYTVRPCLIPFIPPALPFVPIDHVSSSRPIVEREWQLFSGKGQEINDLLQVAPQAA